MNKMFFYAKAFNGDISKWGVSRMTDMRGMFSEAASFNADLSKWDVSKVTKMDRMFYHAASFNQKLCGAAWINSKATKKKAIVTAMFEGSSGSISPTVCTPASTSATKQVPQQDVSRRSMPERELIVRTPITTSVNTPAITSTIIIKMVTCPRCGTFAKSGRNSCCAPGGAWFKNCGGARNKNVEHKWFEGVAACKKLDTTTTTISSVCPRCGSIGKSGKSSCCGRGGS